MENEKSTENGLNHNTHWAAWVQARTGVIVLCSLVVHVTLTVPLSNRSTKWVPIMNSQNVGAQLPYKN